jgi:SAM-dependent MidA family methyltransferase
VEFIRGTNADGHANAGAGSFAWCELALPSAEVAGVSGRLPREAGEGYTLDLPLRAAHLVERIAAQPWRGLFLAFDYGRTWSELCTGYPAGTGRAYAAHRQSEDLLANPGQQDLTCHVCWDWLADALHVAGFTNIHRESQEAFFMHHAAAEMERIVRADRNPLSRARSQLKHLLHPGIMGQRFEVLRAERA